MPTTYAHYKLGEAVTELVTPKARGIIENYPELFHFGVHGPDLLFYYHALKKNTVNTLGARLHKLPGECFFANAVQVLRRKGEMTGDGGEGNRDVGAYYAYAYGFLCHFALDVCCHGYIQDKIDESGITHSEIEAELDRELLVRDGKDPVSQKLTGHLVPSGENAGIICSFFPGLRHDQVYRSMTDMVKYLDLLVLPGKVRRRAVLLALRGVGHYESMHGLIINYEKNPACEDSTRILLGLFEKAVSLAVELIDSFDRVVAGEQPLQEVFRYNFSSQLADGQGRYPVDLREQEESIDMGTETNNEC